jgi:hypothetical protein
MACPGPSRYLLCPPHGKVAFVRSGTIWVTTLGELVCSEEDGGGQVVEGRGKQNFQGALLVT